MKKKILLFLLIFIPFMINAEEKCTIISGNGQDIGSEIACGTEHFYVIENKEDSVRMLAKYNLDIGYEFNKVTVSEERHNELMELCSGSNYCSATYNEPEFLGYTYIVNTQENDDGRFAYLLRKMIDYDEVKQNSKAIGAHGDTKGNPEFPEYGVVNEIRDFFVNYNDEIYANGNIANLELSERTINIFEQYNTYLDESGYNIISYDFLALNEIDNILNEISENNLPLSEWGIKDNWEYVESQLGSSFYIVGSLKDYFTNEYNWLYNTTFWTKTSLVEYYNGEIHHLSNSGYVFFIDTLGNVCSGEACDIALGAGIRPVVEISKNSINYNLTTKSDKGGTLETDKSHVVGDTIVLNAKPKTGYKLEKLIVTTDSGTTIEISGKDIVENEDGTISINPDVFTMPLENVVVEAKWAFVNPKTGVSSLIGVMFTLMLIGISGFFMIRNCNNSYEL